ncbi:pickpocket protein 28-like [Musca vetustissima]|uniref:pickpocket protein 28-like n=1 Tax=Musca vetustissima TaxID=27455 RepID=UPI002AB78C41|nr:pickpocket protein 28-like [Musca vetustissima]
MSTATELMQVNRDAESNINTSNSNKKKPLCQAFKETFIEYSGNTALHGVPYFSQQRPLRENIFWLCVIFLSLFYCVTSVMQTFGKWKDRPVIVSFSESSVDISKIPFPAVTICPETKRPLNKGPSFNALYSQLKSIDAFSGNSNITSKELRDFLTLAQVCDLDYLNDGKADGSVEIDLTNLQYPPLDYMAILSEMAPDLSMNNEGHFWSSNPMNITHLYTKIYTEEGVCYTFNGLNATDLYRESTVQYRTMGLHSSIENTELINRTLAWSLEQGYAVNSPLNTYPARVVSCGSSAGLRSALFNLKENNDYTCRGPTQGYKLILHSPDTVPSVSKRFVRIDMGKEVSIAVKPKLMQTSSDIAIYSPQKRQCYFEHERPLKFFKIYNADNCELECLTNYTLHKCDCVRFSMPHTADMPICNLDAIECYKTAEEEMLFNKFKAYQDNQDDGKLVTQCNCLPSCTSLEYDMQISKGHLDVKKTLMALLNMDTWLDIMPDIELSLISIYFKNNQFIATKRSKLFSFYDLLSNCGGIGGLFIGFSLLSIAEIIFHFTMRLWANWKAKKE